MEEKDREENYEHNFGVLLRYALPFILTFGSLSFYFQYIAHRYAAAVIATRITLAIGILTVIFHIILRFLSAHVKLPCRPISVIEADIYLFVAASTLLIVSLISP